MVRTRDRPRVKGANHAVFGRLIVARQSAGKCDAWSEVATADSTPVAAPSLPLPQATDKKQAQGEFEDLFQHTTEVKFEFCSRRSIFRRRSTGYLRSQGIIQEDEEEEEEEEPRVPTPEPQRRSSASVLQDRRSRPGFPGCNDASTTAKPRLSEMIGQLLASIYSEAFTPDSRRSSSSTMETDCVSTSSVEWIKSEYQVGRDLNQHNRLVCKSADDLTHLRDAISSEVSHAGARLVRNLRRRDALITRRDKKCDFVTAYLQALSEKRSEDTRMRFTTSPLPGESGFNQWRDAMTMVARLPGGIPPDFRRRLWLTLAEKYLEKRNVDWRHTERVCFNENSNPDDEELGIQIVKDLHRTGCTMFCGVAGQQNQALLQRVLLAFARFNKAVGYCQGFNMLAAIILQVTERSESDALKVMIFLIEGVLPESYFANNLRGLSVDMAVFRDLLRLRLPSLSRHLEALQHDARDSVTGTSYEPPLTNVFTMQWFLTLFTNCLPQPTVLRIWDLILLEGNPVLLRTALAIWETLAERIMSVESADEFYSIMGVLTREMLEFGLMDSNNLVKAVVRLTLPELPDLRDKYLYNITPWSHVVGSAARRGLGFFHGGDDDDDDETDEDDAKMAVAAAYGLFRSRHRDSVSRGSSPSDRLASLDISALKLQYAKLRERQRQAHIIWSAACTRQPLGAPPGQLAMNHLLLGKSALLGVRGRRAPPPGAVPPPQQRRQPRSRDSRPQPTARLGHLVTSKTRVSCPQPSTGETLHWRDMRKPSSASSPVVEEPPDESDDSSSSSSTELCDEPSDCESDDPTSPLPTSPLPVVVKSPAAEALPSPSATSPLSASFPLSPVSPSPLTQSLAVSSLSSFPQTPSPLATSPTAAISTPTSPLTPARPDIFSKLTPSEDSTGFDCTMTESPREDIADDLGQSTQEDWSLKCDDLNLIKVDDLNDAVILTKSDSFDEFVSSRTLDDDDDDVDEEVEAPRRSDILRELVSQLSLDLGARLAARVSVIEPVSPEESSEEGAAWSPRLKDDVTPAGDDVVDVPSEQNVAALETAELGSRNENEVWKFSLQEDDGDGLVESMSIDFKRPSSNVTWSPNVDEDVAIEVVGRDKMALKELPEVKEPSSWIPVVEKSGDINTAGEMEMATTLSPLAEQKTEPSWKPYLHEDHEEEIVPTPWSLQLKYDDSMTSAITVGNDDVALSPVMKDEENNVDISLGPARLKELTSVDPWKMELHEDVEAGSVVKETARLKTLSSKSVDITWDDDGEDELGHTAKRLKELACQGRRKSERALQLISENSEILSHIGVCRRPSQMSEQAEEPLEAVTSLAVSPRRNCEAELSPSKPFPQLDSPTHDTKFNPTPKSSPSVFDAPDSTFQTKPLDQASSPNLSPVDLPKFIPASTIIPSKSSTLLESPIESESFKLNFKPFQRLDENRTEDCDDPKSSETTRSDTKTSGSKFDFLSSPFYSRSTDVFRDPETSRHKPLTKYSSVDSSSYSYRPRDFTLDSLEEDKNSLAEGLPSFSARPDGKSPDFDSDSTLSFQPRYAATSPEEERANLADKQTSFPARTDVKSPDFDSASNLSFQHRIVPTSSEEERTTLADKQTTFSARTDGKSPDFVSAPNLSFQQRNVTTSSEEERTTLAEKHSSFTANPQDKSSDICSKTDETFSYTSEMKDYFVLTDEDATQTATTSVEPSFCSNIRKSYAEELDDAPTKSEEKQPSKCLDFDPRFHVTDDSPTLSYNGRFEFPRPWNLEDDATSGCDSSRKSPESPGRRSEKKSPMKSPSRGGFDPFPTKVTERQKPKDFAVKLGLYSNSKDKTDCSKT